MTLDGKIAPPPGGGESKRHALEFPGRMDHRRSRARPRARTAPSERRDPGRRRNDSCRQSSAHRSQRPSAAPPAAARDSRFAAAPAAGIAAGAERRAKTKARMMCWFSVRRPTNRRRMNWKPRHPRRATFHASPDGRPDLHAVLRRLGQLEITSVMIEGGATVNGTALAVGIVDKVFLYYAPKILGCRINSLRYGPQVSAPGSSTAGQTAPPASFRRRLRGRRISARSVRGMNLQHGERAFVYLFSL